MNLLETCAYEIANASRERQLKRAWVGGVLCALLMSCTPEKNEPPPVFEGDGSGGPQLPRGTAEGGSSDSPLYPGPYGVGVGDIAEDICFVTWSNPKEQAFDPDLMETRCLRDFYDPEGGEQKLLLINTAAAWCTSCVTEYQGTATRGSLEEEVLARADDGLRALSVLFQDTARNPATEDDAVDWATRFDVGFEFGLDRDFMMGLYADPSVQPFSMVLDTRDMRILLQLTGDQPQVLWGTVDRLLDER